MTLFRLFRNQRNKIGDRMRRSTIRHKHHIKKRKYNKRTHRKVRGGHSMSFQVHYGTKLVSGQEMTKKETQETPNVSFVPVPGKQYTIVMWDPDVPSQFQPGWAHWIVTNIENAEMIPQHIILTYHGPNPPSGTHRYFFGLFEQKGSIHPTISLRGTFDINKFITMYKLNKKETVFMFVSYNS